MGAIVLAGGASRRMGQDKAKLRFRGSSLLEQVFQTLSEITPEIVVVGGDPTEYALPPACFLPDLFPGEGPLGGLLTGLEALGEGWHWVVACDMPLVKVEVLRALESAKEEGLQAIVPEVAGHLEPLCALYHHSALKLLREEFDAGQRALQQAVRTLRVRTLSEEELRSVDPSLESLMNVNTQEEYHLLTQKGDAERRRG